MVFAFRFKFTLHYSLHVAAALLYVSFQDDNFFCTDIVQRNLLVTAFFFTFPSAAQTKDNINLFDMNIKKKRKKTLLLKLTFYEVQRKYQISCMC